MVETITASEKPLSDVFCDKFEFKIPPYQRPYSWTTEEAVTLLDDLLDACREAEQVRDIAPYFLGSIVLIKSHEAAHADVIDGQQRLTTLTILFSVLKELAADGKVRRAADALIRQEGDFGKGTEDTFRLTLRDRDADFFRKHIQLGEATTDPDNLVDAQRNLVANRNALRKRLEDIPEDERGRLLQFAVQRCFLVAVQASDRASAYRVFSVMNNRGLDLTATDILKADIIGALDPADQAKYNDRWEDIEEELGREAFGDLFAHIRMIHRKAKMRGTLEKEFRDYVKPLQRPKAFVDEELPSAANAYEAILSRTVPSARYGAEINRLLSGLSLLDNFDWQPPAIKFIADHHDKAAEILTFLKALDRLAYSMFIRRVDVNGRIGRYADTLRAMERNEDLTAEGLLGLNEDEKAATMDALDQPIYLVQKIRKQVLLRLDEAMSEGSARYELPVVNIEHVLPQTPDADGSWAKAFPDEEERAYWLNRLGNLALLSRYKNSSASNWDFETKKTKYFTTNNATPFVLTTKIISETEWTPETVKRRHEEALNTLADLWNLA